MTKANGNDLYEDKFARVYADIRRLDQLRDSEDDAQEQLAVERIRRLDERLDGQVTAVSAALAAAEKAVAAALTAADKAVSKAELAQSKVNETQNEFRGSLKDQATMLMPRAEAENVFRELRGLIASQSSTLQELRSRVDIGPPSLSTLQTRSDEQQGKTQGIELTTGRLFGLIGAAGVIAYLIAQGTGHA